MESSGEGRAKVVLEFLWGGKGGTSFPFFFCPSHTHTRFTTNVGTAHQQPNMLLKDERKFGTNYTGKRMSQLLTSKILKS
ncbi:hypothetical protein Bpfe_006301 [Biomphalaria pfeifferi]|uniref:Uncharacterized protein n=1 Tax=Biomphalaria pfeifferi TaxID=112525 RepID=A0AAD8FHZ6_BIOPF|nr:hypothetical protein Bpfe_006301 [Biomphalaria pfeifferi]